jgi:TP901 family phage tail tape measure protein
MALNTLGLGILIYARDEATRVMGKIQSQFDKMGDASKSMSKKFETNMGIFKAGVGVMAAGAVGLGMAFKSAIDSGHFDQALVEAGARMHASEEQMAKLREATFSTNVVMAGFSAEQAAETLKAMGEEGYKAEQSMAALVPTLKLANITGQSGAQAAGAFTDIMDVFGISAENSGATVDKMVHAMTKFGITNKEIVPLLMGVADAAKLSNSSFDDTLVTLGLVKSIIPDVGKATMATRMAMVQLADDGVQKKLRALGISAKDLGTGKMRPLGEVIADVAGQTSKMTEAQRASTLQNVFGNRAAGGMAVIMEKLSEGVKDANGNIVKGADALRVLREELQGSGGAADAELAKKMATIPGQLAILKASIGSIWTDIGSSVFAPIFAPLLTRFVKFVENVRTAFQKMPKGVKEGIGKVLVAISAITVALGGFLAAKGAIVVLVMAMKVLGLTVAGIMAPLLPLVAVFAGLLLLFKAFQVHGEHIKRSLGGLGDAFGKIVLLGKALGQVFSDGGFSGDVREELNKAENGGVKAFAIKVFVWVGRIKNFLRGLSDGFSAGVERLSPAFERVGQAFNFLITALFGGSAGAKENVAAFNDAGSAGVRFGNALAQVAAVVANVVTTIVLAVTAAVEIIKYFYGIVEPIFGAVGQAVGGVISFIGGLLTGEWGTMWAGAVDLVIGAVKTIVSSFGGVMRFVGGAIDKIGSAMGKDWDLGGMADREMKAMNAALDESRTVLAGPKMAMTPVDTNPTAALGKSGQGMGTVLGAYTAPVKDKEDPRLKDPAFYQASLNELGSLHSQRSTQIKAHPGATANRAQQDLTKDTRSEMANLLAAAKDNGVDLSKLNITVVSVLDGEKVAQSSARARKTKQNLSFATGG